MYAKPLANAVSYNIRLLSKFFTLMRFLNDLQQFLFFSLSYHYHLSNPWSNDVWARHIHSAHLTHNQNEESLVKNGRNETRIGIYLRTWYQERTMGWGLQPSPHWPFDQIAEWGKYCIMFLEILRLSFAPEWPQKWFKASFETSA